MIKLSITRLLTHRLFALIASLMLIFTTRLSFSIDPASSPQLQIKLATAILEPYQVYDTENNLTGTGINAIRCIEQASGLRFDIEVFPWKRAQELVFSGEYDGFFVGSRSNKRDQYAQYVGPLLHSFWHWYVPPNQTMDLKEDGTPISYDKVIGVVLGTNMHQWISNQPGYKVVAHTSSGQLFELLNSGRLDYVLATGAMYEEYLSKHKTELNVLVAKSKPLGLYLSHLFIDRQKSIFKLIKKSAAECGP